MAKLLKVAVAQRQENIPGGVDKNIFPRAYEHDAIVDRVNSLTETEGGLAATSSTAGVGYGTGAGGAVTQITSITTGVELNKVCGQITTVASTLAAGAEAVFTVTNSTVAATDVVVVSTTYAGGGTLLVTTKKTVDGAFDITLSNLHASAALDAVVVINFAVIKSVIA